MSNLEQFRKDYPRMIFQSYELDVRGSSYKGIDQDNLFLRKLKREGFTEDQMDKIIGIITEICTECFDNDRGCHCDCDD